MIRRSHQFDLGLDRTRIKDARDGIRQEATVDVLLERLFHSRPDRRWHIQILADEVGMGKTFVGLGTAFSILEAMRARMADDDLRGCYQKVLIITPSNPALFAKWCREIGEFVKRCVKPEFRVNAGHWFSAARVERLDDLVRELRRPGPDRRVIVTSMSIFGGGRLRHYDLKRRHLLGVLFRYWGQRFDRALRESLLKGAPEGWSTNPQRFDEFDEAEQERLLFSDDELRTAIQECDRADTRLEELLENCKEIAAPYVRAREELFGTVEGQVIEIYRAAMFHMIGQALPLVIVDEAHNWKNGPASGSNGYNGFVELIAKRARRVLLLTATPFQLRPAEMLEILKIGDEMMPCPTLAESLQRTSILRRHREEAIRPALEAAAEESRRFAATWSKLPHATTAGMIDDAWHSPRVADVRAKLSMLAQRPGPTRINEFEPMVETALSDIDPEVRHLLRSCLRLFVYNLNLSRELGKVVIRHRRHTEHRIFRVGMEYHAAVDAVGRRPDRHLLHAAPGLDVRGAAELPHYLLMRCVTEMKGGKGRSSVGSALTGCYSTLVGSSEGRDVSKRLVATEVGRVYLSLLKRMVDAKRDPGHPKVQEVVAATVRNWSLGEKTLIFCFRTNTAKRLHDIIGDRIRKELKKRSDRCMGGPEALKALRTRLTGRDRDLIGLGLDRVLWSILWSSELTAMCARTPAPDDLALMDHELPELAALGLRHGVELLSERPDRVFLHRASEHLIARRLLSSLQPRGALKMILSNLATEDWVRRPYGLAPHGDHDEGGPETAHFDERGVHSAYEEVSAQTSTAPADLARDLLERRDRARKQKQIAMLDAYQRAPALWLGTRPAEEWERRDEKQGPSRAISALHAHLTGLTIGDGDLVWESRRAVLQALRRAVLRESVLLRLLPEKEERDEASWGELLVRSFFTPLPEQGESMAERVSVFLEDVIAASGSLAEEGSARYALYNSTKLRDQQFVALVSGNTDAASRERIFSGFNTPLLPEVLICTSVGQEGIDLHRHCRHVVHFDLAWNPAVLEQRTGRTDRIASKTFRERALSAGGNTVFLEIGVPYLAGTYDERMYEELRLRAQTFEVLTGGDLAADDAEGSDDHEDAEGRESGLRFVPLPTSMMEAMRVSLHVWTDSVPAK